MGGSDFVPYRPAVWRVGLALLFCFWGGVEGLLSSACSAQDLSAEGTERQIAIMERARQSLTRQIEQYNETAQKKAREAQTLLDKITRLRQDAQVAGARIELLELQGKRLQDSMLELNGRIARIEQSMKDLIAALRNRVLALYKYDGQEGMNLLLLAEDAHEAITMTYMLERLARQDRVILEELGEKIRELEGAKAALAKNSLQLSQQAAELREQGVRRRAAIAEANALLRSAQGQRRKAEEAAREMEAAQREVGQKILALLHARGAGSRENGPGESGARPLPPPSGAPVLKSVPKREDYTYLARGSQLEWPLRGPVITLFGARNHPVFRTKVFNSGIDIRAAAGAPVKAAGPGEVLFSGWLRGFGQVVIVNHGDNLSTVYAHLGRASVGEGDAVRQGSVLGTVGNTGAGGEYSLHFEVRYGGAAKDPMRYLRRI